MSFPKQAWPLLYSHPWHQYLASTPPSSLWSSICFLAQVATCPQVRHLLYILEKHSILVNRGDVVAIWTLYYNWLHYLVHAPSARCQVSVITFSVVTEMIGLFVRYVCCGESDDWLRGGAAGSHSSGDELKFVWGSWVWGSEDWSGLSCSTPLRNYHGETAVQSRWIKHKVTNEIIMELKSYFWLRLADLIPWHSS